jgi:hypothetical protein
VLSGASSSAQYNANAAVTGNAGSASMGGITLGANGTPGEYGNIQAHEVLIYNVAHDAATRANVIRALMAKWGIS